MPYQWKLWEGKEVNVRLMTKTFIGKTILYLGGFDHNINSTLILYCELPMENICEKLIGS